MSKPRRKSKRPRAAQVASQKPSGFRDEPEELRRRLAEAEAALSFYRSKHDWLQSALDSQRHARQMLEASISASYLDTIVRIREVVQSVTPQDAKLIVVTKGDEELLNFGPRQAWHFPQSEDGVYAGYYPSDSAEAISHLESLIGKGGEFLVLPNTAFWWLEHYRELEEWLNHSNTPIWRDERCAIYKFARDTASAAEASPVPISYSAGATTRSPINLVRIASNGSASVNLPTGIGQRDIFCFPIIDWGFRFQRPQQLMLQFAAAGHKVLYLCHQFRKSGEPYLLSPIAPNVWEVSLRGPRYNAYHGVLDEGHRQSLFGALSALCRDCVLETPLAVVQSPFWWPLIKQAATVFAWPVVYDCMDYHAGFSASNPVLIEQERELSSQADLVVASSTFLKTQTQRHARKVLLVRNGCDYPHFAKLGTKPRGNRPVVGYYGAIAHWFDSDLVADLAERRPDWDFILVGSTFSADVSRLAHLPNVSLPGEKPYAQIPDWLAKFDVAILPFKHTALTEAANPVKAYEILASGKPLVSVPLPEMLALAPLARLASTVAEFEQAIQVELAQTDSTAERKRRAFARSNTWQKRFQQLSRALRHLLAKPGGYPSASTRPTQNTYSFL